MHDYAVFEHNRATIGRWLGVISILISGGMSQAFITVYSLTGMEAFTKATITTGVIYFILHWLFNKYIWKLSLFQIPNLSGKWELSGQTLNEDGTIKYNWNANIGIEQTWEKITINLKTKNSQSYSQTATLEKQYGLGGWLLSYSYKNEPYTEQCHELNPHKGYCQIEFDKDISKGNASYFNNNGRRTFGIMKLTKDKND
jgi:hypothetical protein